MSVPWAPGRRALVRYAGSDKDARALFGHWVAMEAFQRKDGQRVWFCPGEQWPDEIVETHTHPDACPRCYAVDTHAPGCMVAANLARGIPSFWAPFAMWEPPPGDAGAHVKVCLLDGVVPVEMRQVVNGSAYQWMCYRLIGEMLHEDDTHTYALPEPGSAFVALGPDGPTLAPWGKG